jgi:calcium/calmodulin-dependent protein kinase I
VRRKDIKPSDDVAVYDEVSILASLINPYIVPLIDFFEGKGCYYIIMELMAGGDLFDRISLRTTYSEKDARDLFRKMLDALKYCHDLGVCHRDLKPKNLLLKVRKGRLARDVILKLGTSFHYYVPQTTNQ